MGHGSASSYMPWPAFLSLPCLTSSSQTACGNWLGGRIATMSNRLPPLIGPPAMPDSASSWVSFRRFLNALNAALSWLASGSPDGGGVGGLDMTSSSLRGSRLLGLLGDADVAEAQVR